MELLESSGFNGAGKSTLFKIITGQEKPDAGSITVGDTVQLAYVDQSREMDPKQTIYQVVSGGTECSKWVEKKRTQEPISHGLIFRRGPKESCYPIIWWRKK